MVLQDHHGQLQLKPTARGRGENDNPQNSFFPGNPRPLLPARCGLRHLPDTTDMSKKKCKQPALLQLLPLICPRKNVSSQICYNSYCPRFQAMFHPPSGLNENVQQFLTLAEAQKILSDLNKILHRTAFNPRVSNPCFILAVLISLGSSGIFTPSIFTSSITAADLSCKLTIAEPIISCPS